MKPTVYFPDNSDREVHMFGDYVGVCWNLKSARLANGDVIRMRAKGEPYISFIQINHDKNSGTHYEDKDSPVEGGLSLRYARQVVRELANATKYVQDITVKGK